MQSGSTCYIANSVDAHSMPVAYTFLRQNGAKAVVRRSANGPVFAVPLEQVSADPPHASGAKRRACEPAEYVDGVDDEY